MENLNKQHKTEWTNCLGNENGKISKKIRGLLGPGLDWTGLGWTGLDWAGLGQAEETKDEKKKNEPPFSSALVHFVLFCSPIQ